MSSASRLASSTKPWSSAPQVTVTTSVGRRARRASSTSRAGDVVLAEHLDHPLRRAVAGVDDDDPVAVGAPAARCRRRPLDVAAVGLGRPAPAAPGSRTRAGRSVDRSAGASSVVASMPERADAPPGLARPRACCADVGEGAVRRRAEVDRGGAAAGRGRPARAEELLAGRDQVVGAAAGPLGVEHQHVGVGGQQVDQQLHLVDQHRRQRLHALDRDAGGDLVGQLDAAAGAAAPSSAARRRTSSVSSSSRHGGAQSRSTVLEGALVGDREGADLLDVVAPELHPQRVLLGRREDVDDAAADRELAALLDQVDAGVRRVGQPAYDVLERRGVARRELDRLEVAEPLDLRLQHRADRRDDDPSGPLVASVAGVAQPAQHREPAADGVAARAEPLVRAASPSSGSRRRRPGRAGRPSGGRRGPRPPARSAVTASTVRPASTRPVTTNGRSAAGPVRSSAGRTPPRASSTAPARVGSARTASARPVRLTALLGHLGDSTNAPGRDSAGGPGQSTARRGGSELRHAVTTASCCRVLRRRRAAVRDASVPPAGCGRRSRPGRAGRRAADRLRRHAGSGPLPAGAARPPRDGRRRCADAGRSQSAAAWRQIVAAERAIADAATPADVLAAAGHLQQVAYRELGTRPGWDDRVRTALPPGPGAGGADNVASRRAFRSMHPQARRTCATSCPPGGSCGPPRPQLRRPTARPRTASASTGSTSPRSTSSRPASAGSGAPRWPAPRGRCSSSRPRGTSTAAATSTRSATRSSPPAGS